MVANERRYRISRSEARKFKEALACLEESQAGRKDVHPRLLRAEREALEGQLEDLSLEIKDYEALRSSTPTT